MMNTVVGYNERIRIVHHSSPKHEKERNNVSEIQEPRNEVYDEKHQVMRSLVFVPMTLFTSSYKDMCFLFFDSKNVHARKIK
jgi:hypothetical protein